MYIECLPYYEILKRYDKDTTLFYLDPPYWNCEDYYGAGVFSKEDFIRLADILKNIKGKFVLSLNDKPEVRGIFASFKVEEANVYYSCSNGKHINASELIIKNFD